MATPTARTLRPEDEISHYRIVGPIGAGGMGEVYLAQDQSLERRVALKILPPDLVRSEERVRRFVLEAKLASSLSHPNIVTIYEIGQDAVRSSDHGARLQDRMDARQPPCGGDRRDRQLGRGADPRVPLAARS